MKIHYATGDLAGVDHRCLVVLPHKEGEPLNGPAGLSEQLAPFVASGEFGKKLGEDFYLINPTGLKAERVLAIAVGEKVTGHQQIRRATAKAWKKLRAKGIQDVLISLDGLDGEGWQRAAVEGLILGSYTYTELKSEKEKLPKRLENLTVHAAGDVKQDVERWAAICGGTFRARDLSQMPANILTPTHFAEKAREWGEAHGFKTSVMDEATIKAEGMGAMYSVGRGSEEPSQFIIMEYQPQNPSGKTVCLVGKAVTFDTGGISLKPANSMAEMKGDMGGGAAVLGAMSVLKAAGCRHRVMGLVPAVENMPSSKATKPSDVVTSLAGLTVEINNTDAEGRLILIDALTYAARYEPDYVIDFATLTGACLVALGPKVYAVMGNHPPLVKAILAAGEKVQEPFWELPLVEDYKEFLKSDVADISNISSVRWGGTITAGLFLERFAGKYNWAHCDIAAAIFEKPDDINPSGGNGAGVRMIVEAMENLD